MWFIPKTAGGSEAVTGATPGNLCNFYTHLSLEIVSPALKLKDIYINMNICSPSSSRTPCLKGYPLILTKHEKTGTSEIPISQLFTESGKIGSAV